jgi:hypothetical protein
MFTILTVTMGAFSILFQRAASESATGTAAVYNHIHGVALVSFGSADFGDQGGNPGNNAFSENITCDFQNTGAYTVNARNDQWQDDTPRVCNEQPGANTSPIQRHAQSPLSINQTSPTFPSNVFLQGQTVRVYGLGFDAIAGNPLNNCTQGVGSLTTSCCVQKTKSNTCDPNTPHTPTAGNCVEFQRSSLDGGASDPAAVTAVTPTTITAETDSTVCIGSGELVWVSKYNGVGVSTANGAYCTNNHPY